MWTPIFEPHLKQMCCTTFKADQNFSLIVHECKLKNKCGSFFVAGPFPHIGFHGLIYAEMFH